jgi:uncharacterized protein (TIGR01244 family)
MKSLLAVAAILLIACSSVSGQARKDSLAGVRNFTVVDPTIGCAGATDVEAIPLVAARGYKSIVNLRAAGEPGAAIDASRAAAEKAGVKFIHLPFNGAAPDASVADAFIKAVTDKTNQPVFVNCGSANRVAGLWLAKRLTVDKWDRDKAIEEARFIGLSSAALEKFAVDYAAARRK